MVEKIDLEKVKGWLRARGSTMMKEDHLKELLSEKFENPDEIINFLIEKGLATREKNGWIDLISVFRGIYIGEYEEEE
jgi:hypothetical protein